jgi:hypothetical protein
LERRCPYDSPPVSLNRQDVKCPPREQPG